MEHSMSYSNYYVPVAGKFRGKRANCFTQEPFQAVPQDGQLRDSFTDHKADPHPRLCIWRPRKDKQPGRYTSPLLPHSLEIAILS
jgi:hypothetical protein